jgi:hypothetical protein
MKALIDSTSDRILGFSAFGAEAGEVLASVQVAMLAELPFTALRDAIFTHPTMSEGPIALFSNAAPASAPARKEGGVLADNSPLRFREKSELSVKLVNLRGALFLQLWRNNAVNSALFNTRQNSPDYEDLYG